jgi:predicted metal-dependent hydrolase
LAGIKGLAARVAVPRAEVLTYMEYELIRSNRKTLAVEIKSDGRVIVRAPMRVSKRYIESFLDDKSEWIRVHRAKVLARKAQEEANPIPALTDAQLRGLKKRASVVIPERVAYFAPLVGVDYGTITIRSQKTRWGSCSSKGNLNFNCLLLLAPPQVLDYVVVHELCHRKQMNHSPRFWAEVAKVIPDYKTSVRWLKENGGQLMHLIT